MVKCSCLYSYLFSVSSSFLRRFASSRRLCNKAIFSLSEPSWLSFNILFSCWRRISFSLNEQKKNWLSGILIPYSYQNPAMHSCRFNTWNRNEKQSTCKECSCCFNWLRHYISGLKYFLIRMDNLKITNSPNIMISNERDFKILFPFWLKYLSHECI